MCGRFTLTIDSEQLQEAFPWLTVPEGIEPRYNIAPTQPVAVVPNDGRNRLDFFTWGLIPSWSKDPSIASRMINARAETLAEKPSFRTAFRRRRCLILADGFYEWRQEPVGRAKTPMYIQLKEGRPFAFAGLWESWQAPQGEGSTILSCTIITTDPNPLTGAIHNRMPAILDEKDYGLWLSQEEQDPQVLSALLRPYPEERMQAYPVSSRVNSPSNESAELIQPV